jgi:RNA polymerase subunit RPABC4/transcription elongation factor Spt4
MKCTACNIDIPDDGKFCPECGTTVDQINSCKSCGEINLLKAAFCTGCGKSMESVPALVSALATDIMSDVIGTDFAYLLDEESYRSVSKAKIEVPYGGLAITIINGKISGVREQVNYRGNQKNSIVDFLKNVYDSATALIGKQNQEVKTYVLQNLQGLPIVSYSHSICAPGAQDACLKFDFWIDTNGDKSTPEQLRNIGLFFERCVSGKRKLTQADFKTLAMASITSFIGGVSPAELTTPAGRDNLTALLLQATGIFSRCTYTRGRKQERRFLDVSKYQKPVTCPGCSTDFFSKVKFCEVCGQDLSNPEWIQGALFLQAENGEEITLRLNFMQDIEDGVVIKSDGQIADIVIQHLGPILRRRSVASLMTSEVLSDLEMVLNSNLLRDFQGYISDIKAVDIKTASEEWFFKTNALINEELRNIEADKRFLAVDESETDYMAAAFSMAIRRVKQSNSEQLERRKVDLESKAKNLDVKVDESEIEIREHALDTNTNLRKDNIDVAADRERMLRDRDLNRQRAAGDREDGISEADHLFELDTKSAKHDINLADLTGEAQSRSNRRDVADSSFEHEEAIRLEAQKKAQLGNIDEDLQDRQNQRQVDKMRAMAELEANMTKQDNEFELSKVISMKGMSAQEILLMQATQLAKAGQVIDTAEIIKATSGASLKDEMYQKMLDNQKEAAQVAIGAHKSAADSALKSSENMAKVASAAAASSNDGYKEAAKIAQTTNEKSMESMAKVATATAAKKPNGKEDAPAVATVNCSNSECDHVFEGKPKKFCPKCGEAQTATEGSGLVTLSNL